MAIVCADRQRRTCIEVARGAAAVKFIMLTQDGIMLDEVPSAKFDSQFTMKHNDYPVDKAARNYVNFSRSLGASNEAMIELAKLIPEDIAKEIQMAVTKKEQAAELKAAKQASAKKSVEQKPLTTKERDLAKKAFFGDKKAAAQLDKSIAKPAKATKVAVKQVAEKPAAKASKPTVKPAAKVGKADVKEKRHTASQMFQDLIMAGKFTDAEIFKQVQTEFGLDDKKRAYVKWYRNNLTKLGHKVPPAKAPK